MTGEWWLAPESVLYLCGWVNYIMHPFKMSMYLGLAGGLSFVYKRGL